MSENKELIKETILKTYDYAGAEKVAGQLAKMLNDSNNEKRKSYFVRKDIHGCYLIEITDLRDNPSTETDENKRNTEGENKSQNKTDTDDETRRA